MAELSMLTVTRKEEAALELQGARARLSKVLFELETYRGRHDHDDATYMWLLTEFDEASKNLMHARQALEAL